MACKTIKDLFHKQGWPRRWLKRMIIGKRREGGARSIYRKWKEAYHETVVEVSVV